jgi:hypothetical protein
MGARPLSRQRWFLRDIPRTYVLLVWLAFGAALLVYSNDWHPSGWNALRRESAQRPPASITDNYTGSIIIVPTRGENCRQMMLDNRTGRMWEKGIVNCYEAVPPSEKEQRGGMSSLRINAIGKAFNRRED